MKILLYPQIYSKKGTGNLIRMFHLYKYLCKCSDISEVYITCNEIDLFQNILTSMGEKVDLSIFDVDKWYDAVIYDSPQADESLLESLRKMTPRLIVLDFFNYFNEYADIIINLYNHNNENAHNFNGLIYEGVDYAILSSEIINKKAYPRISGNKPKVLITFGGEDPGSNTLWALKVIDVHKADVTAIIGYLNKDKDEILSQYSDKVKVIGPTPFIGELLANNDIVMCGGGTTLMEAIYLGNPIVSIPQNELEDRFIRQIASSIKLFKLEEIPWLIQSYSNIEFRKDLRKKYRRYVDGKGKERIKKIVIG